MIRFAVLVFVVSRMEMTDIVTFVTSNAQLNRVFGRAMNNYIYSRNFVRHVFKTKQSMHKLSSIYNSTRKRKNRIHM